MAKSPCGKNCPDRVVGCHITCEKWAAYEKERNAEYDERAKQRTFNDYFAKQSIKIKHYIHSKRRT